ncbi:MAG: tetratricopeptide repeat protein [Candidatus Marinimicrobia bacterium]|nr:tetratricopeptide repeat protein [Candidatus Neomarinimicrobiota bacterium]
MKNLAVSALILASLFGQLMAQYQDEVLVKEAREAIKNFNIVTADSAYKAAMKASPDEDRYNEIQKEWAVLEQINVRLTDGGRALGRAEYDEAYKKYGEAVAEMNASPLKIWGRFKAEAYYSMGMVHFRKEEPIKAADKFREAAKFDPTEEKYDKAIEMVRNKHYTEGHKFLRRKDYESARLEYEKSVAVDPAFASGYYQLAYIAKRDGNLKAAEDFYLEAVTSDATHYKAWYGLGNLYSEIGNNAKAIETLKTAISINPKYEKSYYVIGKVYESQKSYSLAVSNLKKAIEVDNKYSLAYELLAKIYIDQEKYDTAIALLKDLTGSTVSYVTAYHLAQAYNATGDHSAALTASSTSLAKAKKKNWAPAQVEKGDALKGLGRNKEAIASYRLALQDARWNSLAQHKIDEIMKG